MDRKIWNSSMCPLLFDISFLANNSVSGHRCVRIRIELVMLFYESRNQMLLTAEILAIQASDNITELSPFPKPQSAHIPQLDIRSELRAQLVHQSIYTYAVPLRPKAPTQSPLPEDSPANGSQSVQRNGPSLTARRGKESIFHL
ncbi:hypothetical protein TNCT_488691 [Trichonephila clavata]|uniref:Uncharacterized protein n=1 Tax=Trichonephila clavata TaxID=2740835 RepID=A0A8X6HZ78_TRICU|nr:hypothetical protein TNCT_488691 [Trichonephila clavata]